MAPSITVNVSGWALVGARELELLTHGEDIESSSLDPLAERGTRVPCRGAVVHGRSAAMVALGEDAWLLLVGARRSGGVGVGSGRSLVEEAHDVCLGGYLRFWAGISKCRGSE